MIKTYYGIYDSTGPNHLWHTSDPPYPESRYKLVVKKIKNNILLEDFKCSENEIVFISESLGEVCEKIFKMNDEWYAQDPNREMYEKIIKERKSGK